MLDEIDVEGHIDMEQLLATAGSFQTSNRCWDSGPSTEHQAKKQRTGDLLHTKMEDEFMDEFSCVVAPAPCTRELLGILECKHPDKKPLKRLWKQYGKSGRKNGSFKLYFSCVVEGCPAKVHLQAPRKNSVTPNDIFAGSTKWVGEHNHDDAAWRRAGVAGVLPPCPCTASLQCHSWASGLCEWKLSHQLQ